jgi:two-component system, NarL family, nitrate/nitrite response regulator NarL
MMDSEHPPAASVGDRKISTFICAAIRLYRDGLAQILASTDRIQVVGTAAGAAEAADQLRRLEVDVLLIDVAAVDAFSAVPRLRAAAPEAKLIALAVPELAEEVLSRAEAGMEGYVTYDASIADLTSEIEGVHRGELICSPRMAGELMRHIGRLAAGHSAGTSAPLTSRQREIATLVGDGLSNKDIAQRLSLSLPTVKNHVHAVLERLQITRRSEVRQVLARY